MGILEKMQELNNQLIKRLDIASERINIASERIKILDENIENLRRRVRALEDGTLDELVGSDKVVDEVLKKINAESVHDDDDLPPVVTGNGCYTHTLLPSK